MKKLIIASLSAMTFLQTSYVICAQKKLRHADLPPAFSQLKPKQLQFKSNTMRIFNRWGDKPAGLRVTLLDESSSPKRITVQEEVVLSNAELPFSIPRRSRVLSLICFYHVTGEQIAHAALAFNEAASSEHVILLGNNSGTLTREIFCYSNKATALPPL